MNRTEQKRYPEPMPLWRDPELEVAGGPVMIALKVCHYLGAPYVIPAHYDDGEWCDA